jgi:hypothetical protein
MSAFTGDAEEDAAWAAEGVNERDQRTMPPDDRRRKFALEGYRSCADPCEI